MMQLSRCFSIFFRWCSNKLLERESFNFKCCVVYDSICFESNAMREGEYYFKVNQKNHPTAPADLFLS